MSETLVRVPPIATGVAESIEGKPARFSRSTSNTSSMTVIPGSREIPGKYRVSFARPANWWRRI
jgi:hypothetical protein